jgi:peptidoglycan/xylan/chitin deacetylase (PgdA/CDA1 family)
VTLDLRASTVHTANRTLDPLWEELGGRLTSRQTESLRPMTWAELAGAPPVLHFGGHTVNHAILSRETDADAEREIAQSVEERRARLRLPTGAFAYPNGQPADYTERETRVLRRLDVPCAVTTSPGRNDRATSILHLRRFPITLGHDGAAFESELAGVRSRLARLAG